MGLQKHMRRQNDDAEVWRLESIMANVCGSDRTIRILTVARPLRLDGRAPDGRAGRVELLRVHAAGDRAACAEQLRVRVLSSGNTDEFRSSEHSERVATDHELER